MNEQLTSVSAFVEPVECLFEKRGSIEWSFFFFLCNKDNSELKLNTFTATGVNKESSVNFCPSQKVISDA